MPWADSDLDFTVVDRADTLGDLLRLLFALLEAVGPKDVADLLTDFDGLIVVDPDMAGRWLRNERRPSKEHLQLIVRLFRSRGLIGTPPARDRLFIRIASFYAKLPAPQIASAAPTYGRTTTIEVPPMRAGWRFRALRRAYKLAIALQHDLDTPGDDLPQFYALADRRRTLVRAMPPVNMIPHLFIEPRVSPIAHSTSWQRFVRKLRAIFSTNR